MRVGGCCVQGWKWNGWQLSYFWICCSFVFSLYFCRFRGRAKFYLCWSCCCFTPEEQISTGSKALISSLLAARWFSSSTWYPYSSYQFLESAFLFLVFLLSCSFASLLPHLWPLLWSALHSTCLPAAAPPHNPNSPVDFCASSLF